jgi:hypothetical protein
MCVLVNGAERGTGTKKRTAMPTGGQRQRGVTNPQNFWLGSAELGRRRFMTEGRRGQRVGRGTCGRTPLAVHINANAGQQIEPKSDWLRARRRCGKLRNGKASLAEYTNTSLHHVNPASHPMRRVPSSTVPANPPSPLPPVAHGLPRGPFRIRGFARRSTRGSPRAPLTVVQSTSTGTPGRRPCPPRSTYPALSC